MSNEIEKWLDQLFNPRKGGWFEAYNNLIGIGAPAVEYLIPLLEYWNESVSILAIDILGEIGDARAVEPVIQLLQAPHRNVRYLAVSALEKLHDSRAIEPLKGLLNHSSGQLRARAIHALSKMCGSQAMDLLVHALQDSDVRVRWAAVLEIKRIRATDELSESELATLNQSDGLSSTEEEEVADAEIAREAAEDKKREEKEFTEQSQHPLVIEELIVALHHKDYIKRRVAARLLFKHGNATAIPTLISALQDYDEEVRLYAVRALGRYGDERAVDPLREVVVTDVDSTTWGDVPSKVSDEARMALRQIHVPVVHKPYNIEPEHLKNRKPKLGNKYWRNKKGYTTHSISIDNEQIHFYSVEPPVHLSHADFAQRAEWQNYIRENLGTGILDDVMEYILS